MDILIRIFTYISFWDCEIFPLSEKTSDFSKKARGSKKKQGDETRIIYLRELIVSRDNFSDSG